MTDFSAGAEAIAKTDMMSMTGKLQQMQEQALKARNTSGTKGSAYLAQIKKVSQEFESIFIGYMMKEMRKTVPDDPLMGNSPAKDIFDGMHDDAVSKELSKAGGIGLSTMIYKQLASIVTPKMDIKLRPYNAPQPPMPLKQTDIIA
jgi:flagellar protein FlgJ